VVKVKSEQFNKAVQLWGPATGDQKGGNNRGKPSANGYPKNAQTLRGLCREDRAGSYTKQGQKGKSPLVAYAHEGKRRGPAKTRKLGDRPYVR